jgi:hypothetical protein
MLIDPLQSYQILTPDCPGSDCASFYLPGPADVIDPAISEFNFTLTDIYTVQNGQGWQMDFWALNETDIIPINSSAACPLYGHFDEAFTLCLTQSPDNDHLLASISLEIHLM